MKRFIGYILICLSCIFSVIIGFIPTIHSINGSADFDYGQTFIYKINPKENSNKTEGDIKTGKAIEEVAELFKNRLDKANISTYKLETESEDTIRLSFKAETPVNNLIATYLNFDSNIQVMDYSGKILLESDEFYETGTSYIDYSRNFPIVVLPIKNPGNFKSKLLTAVQEKASSSDENEKYIYLVNNWQAHYSMDKVINDAKSSNTDEYNAYIDRINVSKLDEVFLDYNKDSEDKVFSKLAYINYLQHSRNNVSLANKLANISCAKFNSGSIDYNITLINKDYINDPVNASKPFIEKLLNYSGNYGLYNTVAVSTLLIATVASFIVLVIYLALNYGLKSLAAIALTPVIVLLDFTLFNKFNAEFNAGAIIGLISVTFISLICSLIYFYNIKLEIYSGKNLKKSYENANKRTNFIHIDLSVSTIIFGLVAYLIPNNTFISIGAILIIGGLFNLIINGIFLKILMYFLITSPYIENHLSLLIIDKKLIPNLSNDEKPVYFEKFNKIKNNKKVKTSAIISLVAFLLSVSTLTFFQIKNNNIYNSNFANTPNSRLYVQFEYNDNSNIKTQSDFEEKVLNNLFYFDVNKNQTTKKVEYNSIDTYTYSYRENFSVNQETFKDLYYIVDFNNAKILNKKFSVNVNNTNVKENIDLEEALKYLITKHNNASNFKELSLKTVKNANLDRNNYYSLMFTFIGSLIVSAYILFRFGLGKALYSLISNFTLITICIALLSISRLNVSNEVTLASIILSLLIFSFNLYIYNNEHYLIKEKRITKDINERKDNANYAYNMINYNIIIMSFLFGVISTILITMSALPIYFKIIIIIGIILFNLFNKNNYLIINNWLYKFTYLIKDRIKIKFNNKQKNNQKNTKSYSDGPEEAIFIGIND